MCLNIFRGISIRLFSWGFRFWRVVVATEAHVMDENNQYIIRISIFVIFYAQTNTLPPSYAQRIVHSFALGKYLQTVLYNSHIIPPGVPMEEIGMHFTMSHISSTTEDHFTKGSYQYAARGAPLATFAFSRVRFIFLLDSFHC